MTETQGSRIIIVGFAAQDYVFQLDTLPSGGIKHKAKAFAVSGGGLAANAAVAAARLGGRVDLVTRLGDDSVGRDILADLAAEGVGTDLTRRFAGCRSPLSAIMVDSAGERMLVNYEDLSIPRDTDWLPARLDGTVAAVMGDTRWEAGARHFFSLAREAGVPGVLDGDRAPADLAVVTDASHVAFSAQAMREMAGTDDLPEALARLSGMVGNWLAVTDGPRGVWFMDRGTVRHQPAFPVAAVDTLGAGDTFHGALTLALGEGMDEARAVAFAAAAAALKCTRFGGRAGMPARSDVERMLAGRAV